MTAVPPRPFQSVSSIAGFVYALIATIGIEAHLAIFAVVSTQLALVYVFKKKINSRNPQLSYLRIGSGSACNLMDKCSRIRR